MVRRLLRRVSRVLLRKMVSEDREMEDGEED